MYRPLYACAAILIVPLAVAACNQQAGEDTVPLETANEANTTQPERAAEVPPMIVRSPAYRCDDERALYVDVMNDVSLVLVRDSRQDIPVRLDFNAETQRYEGGGRSLSGIGEVVRYSAPDRPEQDCRATVE